MRRRALLLALTGAAIAAPASLAAPDHGGHGAPPAAQVSIGYSSYTPERLTVVAGDRVRFANGSPRAHTVTADDGSFDSGRLGIGDTYDVTTRAPGEIAYYCKLHAGITGSIEVRELVLAAPASGAAPGRPFPLRGRASLPAGTQLTIEADSGDGFRAVQDTTVREDGRFDVQLKPSTTATYRAVAGEKASNAVRVLVLDRKVALTARRVRGRDVLTATVTPAAPGAHVVLQLRLPDRFGWWPVQRARLDSRSQARFTLRTKRRLPARVRLTLEDDATPLAQSGVRHVGPVKATRRAKPPTHEH